MKKSDLLQDFSTPPPGYGEVPFYWWVGEKLTKERLLWQLERLAPAHPSGLQVNYAHTDKGGNIYGLTMKSDPPLFSEAWWDLFLWWAEECNRRGIAVSLSDYTLGIVGQGWWMDEILADDPAMTGRTLEHQLSGVVGGETLCVTLPENLLSVRAYGPGSDIDLAGQVIGGRLDWHAPAGGEWQVSVVYYKINTNSVDPLNPGLGPMVIEKFFGRFEERMPGEAGKGLNFFFSDELYFGVGGKLWSDNFPAAFREIKGYDIIPLLSGLFIDIGKMTAKVRLDYFDVMLELSERAYFRPVFEWHEQRGMVYGCDHGGRGRDVLEFGDYFRTQRWMSGPGCDQPNLNDDPIKNKVAASIAHLYRRPRVWLEGYHSSGWGTSSADITRATFENFVSGQNLLSLHGLYYSTYGGWWEWAPPCNHFRMPYWVHMPLWMDWLRRISFLLSQGVHRCDVAILYPVAALQADSSASAEASFDIGNALFDQGMDFDFIDDASLERCETAEGELRVAGEAYQVLILPAMRAVRFSAVRKALEFYRNGGMVLALGVLPSASDRIGADDPELLAALDEIFGTPGGRGVFLAEFDPGQVMEIISSSIKRDFVPAASCRVNHRKIDGCDVFMITHAMQGMECEFRAMGKVELWNPWDGSNTELPVLATADGYTRLSLPLGLDEAQFIVFRPGIATIGKMALDSGEGIVIDGDWEFELQPTLDNQWGDFRMPAFAGMIGAEARRFDYREGESGEWRQTTCGYGAFFRQCGPLTPDADPDKAVWRDYEFSWREGVFGDPGHQGYHGLKEQVTDEFMVWGKPTVGWTETKYEPENNPDECHYFRTCVITARSELVRIAIRGVVPDQVVINDRIITAFDDVVELSGGANKIQLRYRGGGRGAFVLLRAGQEMFEQTMPLAMNWYKHPGVVPFDIKGGETRDGFYRFIAPPGLRKMRFDVNGKVVGVYVDGRESEYRNGEVVLTPPAEYPAEVLLRIQPACGVCGGAVFDAPIKLECGRGLMAAGDWSKNGVLENYSGGAWYRKNVVLEPGQLSGKVFLDLGNVVSSAEVWINGEKAGVRLAPPWKMEISRLLRPGDNRIEVLVYNTLSNHYLTIPTRYRGDLTSGLLGPVKLVLC